MKLYQEKLNEYRRAEKVLQKQIEDKKAEIEKLSNELSALKQSLNDEKENLSDYVKNEIILKNYQMGKVQLEDDKVIYYPILEMPDGFKLVQEEIKYLADYDENYEIHSDKIQHKYIIENEIIGLKISVLADSESNPLGYINKDICFWVKESFAMAYQVNYKVIINGKEFELKRNFKDNTIQKVLHEILKDKYICYNDFDEESGQKSSKRKFKLTYELTHEIKGIAFSRWNLRHCENRTMHDEKKDEKSWEELFEVFVKESKNTGNIKNIIQDIKELLKEEIYRNRKLYPLGEDASLVVELFKPYYMNEYCIAYEDEELILEIPYPIKCIGLKVSIVEKKYDENWKSFLKDYLNNDIIVKKEVFEILVSKLDMNKKMPILDIVGNFKN